MHKISEPVSGKNKKKVINLSSTELAQRLVNVNQHFLLNKGCICQFLNIFVLLYFCFFNQRDFI